MLACAIVDAEDEELLMGTISTALLIPNKLHFNILRLLLFPPTFDVAVEAARATAAAALAAAKLAVEDALQLFPDRVSLSNDFCGDGVGVRLEVVGSFGLAVIVTALVLNCLVSLSTDKLLER